MMERCRETLATCVQLGAWVTLGEPMGHYGYHAKKLVKWMISMISID